VSGVTVALGFAEVLKIAPRTGVSVALGFAFALTIPAGPVTVNPPAPPQDVQALSQKPEPQEV
jgi:hypothetical protein